MTRSFEAAWVTSWSKDISKEGLTGVIHDSGRIVKKCINAPFELYEWRLSEELEDPGPPSLDS